MRAVTQVRDGYTVPRAYVNLNPDLVWSVSDINVLVMAALWNRAGHYTFILWFLPPPLPSNRHHRSCGDRLEGKGGNYQVCSVQYCVQQLCTV